MGTPEFAVPSLAEIIANGYNVKRVYTQPARKSGSWQKNYKISSTSICRNYGYPR